MGQKPKISQGEVPGIPLRLFGAPNVAPRVNGVHLTTTFKSSLNNSSGAGVAYGRIYINGSNPLSANNGSATIVPGWTAYASQYRKYRVRQFAVRIQAVNNEAYPLILFTCPVAFQPPLATNAEMASYLSQPLMQSSELANNTGDNKGHTALVVNHAFFSGFSNTNVEDSLVGLTSGLGNSANSDYAVIATDNNGQSTVLATLVEITYHCWVDFMERQTPQN